MPGDGVDHEEQPADEHQQPPRHEAPAQRRPVAPGRHRDQDGRARHRHERERQAGQHAAREGEAGDRRDAEPDEVGGPVAGRNGVPPGGGPAPVAEPQAGRRGRDRAPPGAPPSAPRTRATGRSRRSAASRLVRLDTGSSRLAVLASQTVVIATGSGATSIRSASASMTGVSSTAVVSRLRTTVVAVANPTRRTKRYPRWPRAAIATRAATTSKTSARAASSASTTTAARKTRIGAIRPSVASASGPGRTPSATSSSPAPSRAAASQSSAESRRTARTEIVMPTPVPWARDGTRAVRPIPDRNVPRRRRPVGAAELDLRQAARRGVRAAHRGHRRGAQPAGVDRGHPRRAGLDRHRARHLRGPVLPVRQRRRAPRRRRAAATPPAARTTATAPARRSQARTGARLPRLRRLLPRPRPRPRRRAGRCASVRRTRARPSSSTSSAASRRSRTSSSRTSSSPAATARRCSCWPTSSTTSRMGITHVIRAEEHLPNTPKQQLLWEALGRQAADLGARAGGGQREAAEAVQAPRQGGAGGRTATRATSPTRCATT